MTVIGGTGTRSLRSEDHRVVASDVTCAVARATRVPADVEFVSGGCVGADCVAARTATALGCRTRAVLPRDKRQVCACVREHSDTVEDHGLGFLARDQRIVDLSDVLLAWPLHEEARQPRSGTWATVRRGRRRGIPILTHILQPLEGHGR